MKNPAGQRRRGFQPWWAHKDSNLGPADYSTTTAFAAPEVCGPDHPIALSHRDLGGRRLVSTPSRNRGLGSGLPSSERGRKGSPTLTPLSPRRFRRGLPIVESQLLYQLSYAPDENRKAALSKGLPPSPATRREHDHHDSGQRKSRRACGPAASERKPVVRGLGCWADRAFVPTQAGTLATLLSSGRFGKHRPPAQRRKVTHCYICVTIVCSSLSGCRIIVFSQCAIVSRSRRTACARPGRRLAAAEPERH